MKNHFLLSLFISIVLINCTGGGSDSQLNKKVSINQPPNGVIDMPTGNMIITVGDTINFSGTGSDPDDNLPLSYLWDFGDSAISNSTGEDPGFIQFNNVGIFAVTFTVIDARGFSDPTPDSRSIRVFSFYDDFRTDTTDEYTVVDTWTEGGTGQFIYDVSGQRVWIPTGDNIALQFSHTLPTSDSGNFNIDFLPTEKYPNGGVITFRLVQDASNYYEVNNTDGHGAGRIVKVVNGQEAASVSFQNGYVQNSMFNISINFSPAFTSVEAFGEVLNLSGEGSSIVVNRFEVEIFQQDAYFDNISYTNEPFVRISQPQSYYLQTNTDLSTQAVGGNFQPGWGIKFIIDLNTINEGVVEDFSIPYEAIFSNLTKSEHVLDALVIDSSGVEIPGENTYDTKIQIGIGDYYVALGDSITFGYGDDNITDDISQDGRNSGGGYPPILNDLLSNTKGYPHTVVNEGVEGEDSFEVLSRIDDVIASHSGAQYFFVLYGVNDSFGSSPIDSGVGLNPGDFGYDGSFKDNMQQIITKIVNAGMTPILGKVPITYGPCSNCEPFPDPSGASRNILIREYNVVIDELVLQNGIGYNPPDFYAYFEAHPEEYIDNYHPNGTGYQSMASLWFNALN